MVEFGANVDERGGFIPDEQGVRVRLARLKGKHVTVTVRKWTEPKSLPQLGYYHAEILHAFALHIGDDEDATHEDLKRAFFPARTLESKLTGESYQSVPSLRDATKEEMSEFIDRVIRYAASIGLPIAPPKGSPEWATWASL